jgi:hypothetical protein
MCIFSSDILHDEKVIDLVRVFLLFYSMFLLRLTKNLTPYVFTRCECVAAVACTYQLR